MGKLIVILSVLQRIVLLPAQWFVSLVLMTMNVVVKICLLVDNKLNLSKYIKNIIECVPDFLGSEKYHTKFYLTYTIVAIISLIGLFVFWDPTLLLLAYFMRFVWSGIGAEVANHRYFTHKSFKCSYSMDKVLKICSIFSIEGPAMMWVAQHRVHHRFSDTEFDPHPGDKWHSTFSNIKMPENIQSKITPLLIRDLINDPWHKFIKDNYFSIYWITISLLLLIDVKLTIYVLLLPAIFSMIDSMLVNWLCHNYGQRSHDIEDKSTNNYWLNLWAPGGGLHNNHHADASNYHNENIWWEFDFFRPIIECIIALKTFKDKQG